MNLSKQHPNLRKFLDYFLGVPLTLVSLFFIFYFIFSNKKDVLFYLTKFHFPTFLIGQVFLVLFFVLRSIVWKILLFIEGHKLSTLDVIYLLSSSEIKRYIPGSVVGFVARMRSFNSLKVPNKTTVKLLFYEGIIFVLSNLVVSLAGIHFLLNTTNIIGNYYYLILSILFVIILGVVFALYKKVLSVSEILKYKSAFLVMFFAWVIFGLGNLFVVSSIFFIDPNNLVQFIGLFTLSWLIGYLVIVAPLGLGVREAFLTYSLSFSIPAALAATLSVIARVAFTLAELIFIVSVYLFYHYIKYRPKFSYQILILWSSIISYIFYFTYVSFEKYSNFFMGRFDLGNMDQTVWNTINGRIFLLTNPDGTNIISRLSIHADFLLILLSPFYLIWNDARMLLFLQSLVLGLGALFVYLIGNSILKNKTLSLVLSISYLLNPFLQKQNLFDFHAVTLATTFLLAAFYFSLVKKYFWFLLFLFLSVLTKENLYLISFLFGIYLLLREKKLKWIALSTISIIIFYFLVTKFIPEARGSRHFALEYYSDFGDSPASIAKSVILNPVKTFTQLLSPRNLNFIYKLLLPVGFLPILAPLLLVFAFPDLIFNLLSNNDNLTSINFHYGALIIPFIYISSIYAIKFLLERKMKFFNASILGFFVLIFAIYGTYQYGTLPGSKNPTLEIYNSKLVDRVEISKFLQKIPPNLSVASTNNLGAHLSHREKLYTIPQGIYNADYVIFLLNDQFAQPSLAAQRDFAKKLSGDNRYIKVKQVGDFVAFAKRSSVPLIPF